MIIINLFKNFFIIGLMTFGGGYSVLPLIDNLIVKKNGWLSEDAVADIVSISEMSPGPFSLNCATFVGTKIAGIPGSFVATGAFLLPSIVIVLILSHYYNKYHSLLSVKSIFNTLNACIVGILISSSVSLLSSSVFMGNLFDGNYDLIALIIFTCSFVALFKFKINPVIIIILSAIIASCIYPLSPNI